MTRRSRMIKLIAIDIDGTLINSEGKILQENIEALQYAKDKGAKIVICTGRPYITAKQIVDQLAFSDEDYMINFNGGQIRKARSGELVHNHLLDYSDFDKWLTEMNRLQLPLNLIDNDWVYEPVSYPGDTYSYYVAKITTAPTKVIDYAQIPSDATFNKFVVSYEEEYLSQKLLELDTYFSENYQIIRGYPVQIEIVPKGVNKGTAMIELGKLLNIEANEMMGIGDERNDLFMLEVAGIGVAMGNADPEVKAVSDFITLSNNEAGVAHAIYHHMK